MTPIRSQIIVEPIDNEDEVTDSGIVYKLANHKQDKAQSIGKVVSIGNTVNSGFVNGERITEGNYIKYFSDEAAEVTHGDQVLHIVKIPSVAVIVK